MNKYVLPLMLMSPLLLFILYKYIFIPLLIIYTFGGTIAVLIILGMATSAVGAALLVKRLLSLKKIGDSK